MSPYLIAYHIKEWMEFWYENQMDTYGNDYTLWESPHSLAEIWYDNEESDDYTEEVKKRTVWYSAGVFIGKIKDE